MMASWGIMDTRTGKRNPAAGSMILGPLPVFAVAAVPQIWPVSRTGFAMTALDLSRFNSLMLMADVCSLSRRSDA